MGKVEVNNEIVLMRHTVRQSRVRVVHKLTREIKLLRKKHGDEKQREKYNRKADKLANEILALKKIKDDDVSKFGLTSTRSLQEVLEDKSSSARTRILTRVVYYKTLKDRIENFKNKFPDYEQYLNSGKKKSKKTNTLSSKKKENDSKDSKAQAQSDTSDSNECNKDVDYESDNQMEVDDVSDRNKENLTASDEDEPNKTNKVPSLSKNKRTKAKLKLEKSNKQKEKAPKNASPVKQPAEPIKVVSKEATVKRFTEILQEQSTESNTTLSQGAVDSKSTDGTAVVAKEVDDFFMTGDGSNTYLSVSAPKTKDERAPEVDDDLDNSYRQQKYFKDERFFSKIGKTNGSVGRTKRGAEHQEDRISKKPAPLERKGKKFDFETKRRNSDISRNGLKSANADDSAATENLHPSWAAKKKQQEMIKQGFQGKKIVFDDD